MRTFIALELPHEVACDIADTARTLAGVLKGSSKRRERGPRFMPRANYHITLAFLGELDECGVRAAMEAVDEACAGQKPLAIACDGLGTFGRPSDATLWMGVRCTDQLKKFDDDLRRALAEHWVAYDEKPFRPHITMASHVRFEHGVLPQLAFPREAACSRVTLFKSELTHEGAIYKPLYTVDLAE